MRRLILSLFAVAGLSGVSHAQGMYGGFGPSRTNPGFDRPWTSQAGSASVAMYRGPRGDVIPSWALTPEMRQRGYRFVGNQAGYPQRPTNLGRSGFDQRPSYMPGVSPAYQAQIEANARHHR